MASNNSEIHLGLDKFFSRIAGKLTAVFVIILLTLVLVVGRSSLHLLWSVLSVLTKIERESTKSIRSATSTAL